MPATYRSEYAKDGCRDPAPRTTPRFRRLFNASLSRKRIKQQRGDGTAHDDTYSARLGFRMGLPWQSQMAVSLPFVVHDLRNGDTISGLGDAGFLFSKELMRQNDAFPALRGSVGWTSPTSRSCCSGPIPYVSGFQAGLTASKRLDPLVAFARVSYFESISREIAGTPDFRLITSVPVRF